MTAVPGYLAVEGEVPVFVSQWLDSAAYLNLEHSGKWEIGTAVVLLQMSVKVGLLPEAPVASRTAKRPLLKQIVDAFPRRRREIAFCGPCCGCSARGAAGWS